MKLHDNKELFEDLIEATAQELKILPLYVEKDYWVTCILKQLSKSKFSDVAIFKGGTSLSKAYKIIQRFSEDIDLAVITNGKNSNQIKTLIREIEKDILCDNFQEIKEHKQVSKGSKFRKTVHAYPKIKKGNFGHANENIILELNSFAHPHPFSKKTITTYIHDFLLGKEESIIKEYELNSFEVNVLDYRRTFCEKISAIARASHESDKDYSSLKEKIRHIYDIYFLMKEKDINDFIESSDFEEMIKKVRIDDQVQFNKNDWALVLLSQTEIFLESSKVLDNLDFYYNNNFKDLVYEETLPSMDKIKLEIKKLSIILTNKNL